MVWPWFERLPALSAARDGSFDFSASRYPKLHAWSEAMLSDPDVKATSYPTDLFTQFIKSAAAGTTNGDVGL